METTNTPPKNDLEKVRKGAVVITVIIAMVLVCFVAKYSSKYKQRKIDKTTSEYVSLMNNKLDSLLNEVQDIENPQVIMTYDAYVFELEEPFPMKDSLEYLKIEREMYESLTGINKHVTYDFIKNQKKIDQLTLEERKWNEGIHRELTYCRQIVFSGEYKDSLYEFSAVQLIDKCTKEQQLRSVNIYERHTPEELEEMRKDIEKTININDSLSTTHE